MKKVYVFPDRDRISDDASLWLARMDRGLSGSERIALQEWMAESRENRETLFAMAELWDKMDSLSSLSDLFPVVARKKKPAHFHFRYAAMFATVLVGVMISWFGLNTNQGQEFLAYLQGEGRIYQTTVGGHSLVNLPDNSKVLLNTDSLIRVSYTNDERYIVLERGEAHFTVEKDKTRPFIVQAGDRVIQAVGTAFNVAYLDSNAVSLIVTEGRVAVADKAPTGITHKRTGPVKLSQSSPVVSQGEEAILDTSETTVRKIPQEKIAAELSWQQGNLVFQGETLEEAIREISRYTTVEFRIVDESIKQVRVAGLFKSDDINGLLVTLDENFNIASQRVGEHQIILGVEEHP